MRRVLINVLPKVRLAEVRQLAQGPNRVGPDSRATLPQGASGEGAGRSHWPVIAEVSGCLIFGIQF